MLAPHEEQEVLTLYGERRLVSWNHTVLHDFSGAINGRASIGADVTERRRAEQQLQHNAFHDGLTGLPNRALFMDRLGGALARRRRRPEQRCAVLFVDLDRFKLVNDSLGHAAGDRLLVELAAVLRRIVRPGDTVARLGGDEFAVLIEDLEDAGEASSARRIALEEALQEPFTLGTQDVFVTGHHRHRPVRRGATSGPRTRCATRTPRCTIARPPAPGRPPVLRPVDAHPRAADAGAGERPAPRGRARGVPAALPADRRARRPAASPASRRWCAGSTRSAGWSSPLEFIHLAEETGLIVAIGRWALREACREIGGAGRASPART